MTTKPSDDKVVNLDERRTARFLRELRDKPFITIIIDDKRPCIYTHNVELDDTTSWRTIIAALVAIREQESNANEA